MLMFVFSSTPIIAGHEHEKGLRINLCFGYVFFPTDVLPKIMGPTYMVPSSWLASNRVPMVWPAIITSEMASELRTTSKQCKLQKETILSWEGLTKNVPLKFVTWLDQLTFCLLEVVYLQPNFAQLQLAPLAQLVFFLLWVVLQMAGRSNLKASTEGTRKTSSKMRTYRTPFSPSPTYNGWVPCAEVFCERDGLVIVC